MEHGRLPDDVDLRRTTDELDAESVPAGLLRAHHLAPDVWGLLRVSAGEVVFVWEDDSTPDVRLVAGDSLVIPPEVHHHVEPAPDARFQVEFHR
jgi:tellurite resistance-related uncharacterized protein